MIGLFSLPFDALVTVGYVLAEALILYVGYGVLISVFGSHVTGAIKS